MTPLKQLFKHDPNNGVWGDCHRAAIASMLDLPLADVPHFGDGGPNDAEFNRRVDAFLATRGLKGFGIGLQCELEHVFEVMRVSNPGVYWMLGGQSLTGVDHTVICYEDKIVHDPSLTNAGIIGPCVADDCYWINVLVYQPNRTLNAEVAA